MSIKNIQQNQSCIGLGNILDFVLGAKNLIDVGLIEIIFHRTFKQLMCCQPLTGARCAIQHMLLIEQQA